MMGVRHCRILTRWLATIARHLGLRRDMSGGKEDQTRGDKLILPSKRSVDPRDLAHTTKHGPSARKLPPEPGRTPRATSVPTEEILPRKEKS